MKPALILERFYYSPFQAARAALSGTFGKLTLPDGSFVYTCERPWVGNKTGESCIPTGIYTLRKRRSGVVERTTGGEHLEGWEVTGVPGRTYIMVHPANWPHQLEGCIAPGLGFGLLRDSLAVHSSRDAFEKVMAALEGQADWTLDIRSFLPEYP